MAFGALRVFEYRNPDPRCANPASIERDKAWTNRCRLVRCGDVLIVACWVVARQIPGIKQREVIRDLPKTGNLEAIFLDFGIVFRSGKRILDKPTATFDQAINLETQSSSFGQIDMCCHRPTAIVADARAYIDFHFAARLFRHNADCTADRVAPEQCALWAAQHLNAFNIGQFHAQAGYAPEINAVDINADGRVARHLRGVHRNKPTHTDRYCRRTAHKRRGSNRRYRAGEQIVDRVDAFLIERIGR